MTLPLAGIAQAQPAAPAPRSAPGQSEEERRDTPPETARAFSLTVSPIHLLFPVVELHAEFSPEPHLGLRLIGGYGSVSAQSSDGESQSFGVYELGAQAIAYPMGEAKNLQLGLELLYVSVATEEGYEDVQATADGLAVGPFVGYKLVTSGGFTFVAQGGFEYVSAKAEASDSSGSEGSSSNSEFIPLINLDIGWSF